MTDELKPCPFCGYPAIDAGKDTTHGTYEICCSNCPSMMRDTDKESLVSDWNRRVEE